jgi:hypothetical protein
MSAAHITLQLTTVVFADPFRNKGRLCWLSAERTQYFRIICWEQQREIPNISMNDVDFRAKSGPVARQDRHLHEFRTDLVLL